MCFKGSKEGMNSPFTKMELILDFTIKLFGEVVQHIHINVGLLVLFLRLQAHEKNSPQH